MRYDVAFPGGVAVETAVKGHTIRTDQPAPFGSDSAPAPFDLFIASIATCMGYYALHFCQERGIATEGLGLSVETVRDPGRNVSRRSRRPSRSHRDSPRSIAGAIQRAVDQCAVKKHMIEPPAFELTVN